MARGHRRNKIVTSAARIARPTAASGQVRPRPTRESLLKGKEEREAEEGALGAGAPLSGACWPLKTGNLSRAEFHSIRAFSSAVRERVNSTWKLSPDQLSSRIASTL